MRDAVVQYHKYDGSLHWRHDMTLLGTDEHGTWLGAVPGSIVQRGHEPPIPHPHHFVQLISPGTWWTMLFNGDSDPRHETYVDVIMPAEEVGDRRWEMIDLDLDVVRLMDGSVYVDDEDEFAAHTTLLGYPDSVVRQARAAAESLVDRLRERVEPFGAVAESWLATCRRQR